MNKEKLEAHIERKNRPFYNYIGRRVTYWYGDRNTADEQPEWIPYSAMIINIDDEDEGIVDLCLIDEGESFTATMTTYEVLSEGFVELRHRMIIDNAKEGSFKSGVFHRDSRGNQFEFWDES